MKTANNKTIKRFVFINRDWKGASCVAELEEGGIHDTDVIDEPGALYLCIGHFSAKPTTQRMVDDLNSGKISLVEAIRKTIKSMERWQNKVEADKRCGMRPGIARKQAEYFGATEADLVRLDTVNTRFKKHTSDQWNQFKIRKGL